MVLAFMAATMLSFQSMNFSLINEASAKFIWMSDESGDSVRCYKPLSISHESSISTVPLTLSIQETQVWVEGEQDGCEDASILYACRTSCVPIEGGRVITGG